MSSLVPILTIAGSDCSGGAGIQADIKTFSAFGLYGMSVVTAVTAQNTTGVKLVSAVSPEMVSAQLDAVLCDIFPQAVKIGMLCNEEIAETVCDKLCEYKVKNIVVDPVMLASDGHRLLSERAIEVVRKRLFPMATLITPNIPEAQALLGTHIKTSDSMEKSAEELYKEYGCAVLVKGGHSANNASDYLFDGELNVFNSTRVDNPNTHGTGCTLSSAIACGIAVGRTIPDSVRNAKQYIQGAILDGMNFGSGNGPLNHLWQKSQ